MNRAVRLGAVNYLNVRPLVHGLDERPEEISLRFDVPSTCATLLAEGSIDLGMVPSITYLDRPTDRIVPGVCIGSDGPVASVALFTRVPIMRARRIALDTSSRTSVALVKILCARRYGIAPVFEPRPPDVASMLAQADAALIIGDAALFLDYHALGPEKIEKIDLGQVWTEMTGLPFVWAFWSGRADAADARTVALLQSAAEAGATHTDAIAEAYCAGDPARIGVAQRYLRDNLVFALDGRALEGLRAYYREAAAVGAAPAAVTPELFSAE